MENSKENTLRESISENSILFRTLSDDAVKNANRSSTNFSLYLQFISGLGFGLTALLLESHLPKGDVDRFLVFIAIVLLPISVMFGALNQFLIVKFWEKAIYNTSKVTAKWFEVRGKSHTDSLEELVNLSTEAHSYMEGVMVSRRKKSEDYPRNLQLITLSIGLFALVIYLSRVVLLFN